MYKLLKIEEYEVTRDLILENLDNHQIFNVFDDTDITDHDDFKFMKSGESYDCKIAIFAEPWETYRAGLVEKQIYQVLGHKKVAGYDWLKLADSDHNIFYIDHVLEKYQKNDTIDLAPLRYDILAVNGIERVYDLEDV